MSSLRLVAELDDELMEKYLEGEEITVRRLQGCIRKATIANSTGSRICGTSYKNKGVQKLLDADRGLHARPTRCPGHQGHQPQDR